MSAIRIKNPRPGYSPTPWLTISLKTWVTQPLSPGLSPSEERKLRPRVMRFLRARLGRVPVQDLAVKLRGELPLSRCPARAEDERKFTTHPAPRTSLQPLHAMSS